MFKLTIEDDEGKTTVIPLVRDEMTIGRQEGNTIRLTERNVSRRHARLVRQNDAVFIEDLASFTGVRVNGLKITALTAVRDGDHVQIGDYRIQLKADRTTIARGGERSTVPTMHAVMGTTAQYGAAIPGRNATVPMVPHAETEIPTAPLLRFPGGAGAAASAPSPAPPLVDSLPIPTSLDGQPTIPVRRLEDLPPAPVEVPAPPARLVVLSSELAGQEFALNRPSLVIGRTDENDITLNHRSISRHHAKIVRERDHYTVFDLQSANGVRVNGEDYERIELHAGDILELGHVRIRFVGPFESYVYDPKTRFGGKRLRTKVAFVAGGVALAAMAIVVVQRNQRPNEGKGAAAITQGPPPPPAPPAPPAAVPPVPAPAAVASLPAAPAPGGLAAAAAAPQAVDLLEKARTEAKGEDWDAALSTLDQLADRDSHDTDGTAESRARHRDATLLRRKIEAERRGATAFAQFEDASSAKNYAEALERFAAIPANSLYKNRARPRYVEARALLVAQHLAAAEKFRAAGRCADVRAEAAQIEKIDPAHQASRDLVRLCRSPRGDAPVVVATAAVPRAARARPPGGPAGAPKSEQVALRQAVAETPASRAAEAGADAETDAESLIRQAREAWLRQQCGSAIDLSRKALKAKPGLIDAYQVIAVCSCSLKDAEGATRAYGKLDDKSRSLVRSLCQKHGIALGGD